VKFQRNGFDFIFFLDRIYRITGIFFACGEGPFGRRPLYPDDPVNPVQLSFKDKNPFLFLPYFNLRHLTFLYRSDRLFFSWRPCLYETTQKWHSFFPDQTGRWRPAGGAYMYLFQDMPDPNMHPLIFICNFFISIFFIYDTETQENSRGVKHIISCPEQGRIDEISDHQRSWGYEDGPWKGPEPPLLVAADLSQFISRRHRSELHLSIIPSR
jgi:hypothetical protein